MNWNDLSFRHGHINISRDRCYQISRRYTTQQTAARNTPRAAATDASHLLSDVSCRGRVSIFLFCSVVVEQRERRKVRSTRQQARTSSHRQRQHTRRDSTSAHTECGVLITHHTTAYEQLANARQHSRVTSRGCACGVRWDRM